MHLNSILQRDDIAVITGSERVARELRSRRSLLKVSAGESLWSDPVFCGPFRRFLIDAWDTLFDGRQLLHSEQVLTLCKQTIDRSGVTGAISTMPLARTMRHAEKMICEHAIPVDRDEHLFGDELRAFYDWHQCFQERLARSGYVTEHSLLDLLGRAVIDDRWQPPKTIALVGFVDLLPQQRAFIEVLRKAGTEIIWPDPEDRHADIRTHLADTLDNELEAAANWFRHVIDQTPTNKPLPRMALIVPELDSRRSLVSRVLEAELSPNCLLAGVQSDSVELDTGFAFAGGSRLADLPWVRSAMDLVALRAEQNHVDDLSRLLLGLASPLDKGISFETSNLDLKLRKHHGWKVSGKAFVTLLSRSDHPKLKELSEAIETFLFGHEETQLPSQWADCFETVIKAAGFLNESWLNRGELHQWWAFEEALDIFRSLDAQLGSVSAEPAYRWLDEICHTRWFSHENDSAAAVQVLSPREALGLSFDKVWIVGLDSKSMPGQVAPNPFLPVHRQSDAGVISSSPELNTQHALRTMESLLSHSDFIVLSRAKTEQGGALLPSGVIDWERYPDVGTIPGNGELPHSGVTLVVSKAGDRFPGVTSAEKAELKNGLSLLGDYAKDSLTAALVHRLHIKPFPQVQAGLSSSIQGQLVHAALARFWLETKTSDKLQSLSNEARKAMVEECVTGAMKADKSCSASRYGWKLLSLERRRIVDLVTAWLDFEMERPEPFEVIACEGETSFAIEGMEFPVRIDRIDRVFCHDGRTRHVIIDYKTGRIVDMRALNADRLTEPQLPVYSTFTDLDKFGIPAPDGVALGKVFANELAIHTRSSWTTDLLKDSTVGTKSTTSDATWQEQLEAWKNRLIGNARGFLSGDSQVFYRPHEYLGNHEYLAPLMRLGELRNDTAK